MYLSKISRIWLKQCYPKHNHFWWSFFSFIMIMIVIHSFVNYIKWTLWLWMNIFVFLLNEYWPVLDIQHKCCQFEPGQCLLNSQWCIHYDLFLFNIIIWQWYILLMQLGFFSWMEIVIQLFQMTRHNFEIRKKKRSFNSVAHTTRQIHTVEPNHEWARHEILWQRNIFFKIIDLIIKQITFERWHNKLTFIRVSIVCGYHKITSAFLFRLTRFTKSDT